MVALPRTETFARWQQEKLPVPAAAAVPLVDRFHLLAELATTGESIWLWNRAYGYIQGYDRAHSRLQQTQTPLPRLEALPECLASLGAGILVLEGILDAVAAGDLDSLATVNVFLDCQAIATRLLATGESLRDLPEDLHPLLVRLEWQVVAERRRETLAAELQVPGLIEASRILSPGELSQLARSAGQSLSLASVRDYGMGQLRALGAELLPAPNVGTVGGADVLIQNIGEAIALLQVPPEQLPLAPPKGGLLQGPPGTGKTLTAKFVAQQFKIPLLAFPLDRLRGETPRAMVLHLQAVFERAARIAPLLLFVDEIDKVLTGYQTDPKLAAVLRYLLIVMEDGPPGVFLLAALNRMEQLPAELVRRFPYIWFADLPHAKARYEILLLHLQRLFPSFNPESWEFNTWYRLAHAYDRCTGSEIAQSVERMYIAKRATCDGDPEQMSLPTPEDLHRDIASLSPLATQGDMARQLELMRRTGGKYRKICSPDTSDFAKAPGNPFLESESRYSNNGTNTLLRDGNPPDLRSKNAA